MKQIKLALAATLVLATELPRADDIDVYLNPATAGGAPYIHLVLDYRPEVFNTLCTYDTSCLPPFMSQQAYDALGRRSSGEAISRYDALVAVLDSLFTSPQYQDIYLSLGVSNLDTGEATPVQHGGSLLSGFRQIGNDGDDLLDILRAVPTPLDADSTHLLQPKHNYYEWYRYLNGGQVIDGADTALNFDADPAAPRHDTNIMNGALSDYQSPFDDPAACVRLFTVMLALGPDAERGDLDATIETDFGLGTAASFSSLLAYLHGVTTDLIDGVDGDQPLQKTWVISDAASAGTSAAWSAAGGSGSPLDIDDPAALEEVLASAFTEVVSVSGGFAAPAAPVNVFDRGEALADQYLPLFRPEATQRWPGNIKKLKLVDTDGDGVLDELQDAAGQPALETSGPDRGRLAFDALTFWTDADELSVGDGVTEPVDSDGRVVARGGAGQQVPGFIDDGAQVIGDANIELGARQLLVEPAAVTNGSANALLAFDVTDALADELLLALGAQDRAEARELIAWGRGQDVDDEDGDSDLSEARSWLLGGVFHSRPLALNYGALGSYDIDNPLIRLFFGSNDGILHIVENTDSSGAESGREVTGFLPRDTLGVLKYQREDNETAFKMRYGVDGAPVVFTRDINADGTLNASEGDEALVYFGLRRGGFSYYALDVSDPDVPPTLRWKITQTSGGDFDELGLTFSTPVVGKVRFGAAATDVLIFSGGYNGGWNSDYTARVGKDGGSSNDRVGNAIYIVNARTGDLIWKFVRGSDAATNTQFNDLELSHSIPSDIAAMRNSAGVIHRLYFGDSGGTVWRVDLPPGSGENHRRDNWFGSQVARLGVGLANDRRFFHAPDVIQTFDDIGSFDGVLISSGNRARPSEDRFQNYHFYLKDRFIVSGDPTVKLRTPFTIRDTVLPDQTACVTGAEEGDVCADSLPNGWKIALESPGEKGLSTPLVSSGRVLFTSFVPPQSGNSCEPGEGRSRLYLVNLDEGTAAFHNQRIYDLGPGIPDGAQVLGNSVVIPGPGIEIIDQDDDGTLDLLKLIPALSRQLFPIFWREPGVDEL